MTTFREIYLWINRYTEDAQSQYRGRKSHLTLSTQALLNQTHALVNEHRVSEVWSMVSRLTDLCNCESYSVNERAEIFLECGFIVSGLGSSFDAAEHFDKAASNYICLHNMSIAFWGKGLNLWRMIEEHQNAIVAWRLAMDAFSDCCETTKKEIDTLRGEGKT